MITGEDIERTREMMTRMLRSFETNVGDVVPAPQKKRGAMSEKTDGRGTGHVRTMTDTRTNGAQRRTRSARQNRASVTREELATQDAIGLPLDVCTNNGVLASPTTFDSFAPHRMSSHPKSEDWIETLLTSSSPGLPNLCDVKFLVSPTTPGGARLWL